jgi:hypothetical protein
MAAVTARAANDLAILDLQALSVRHQELRAMIGDELLRQEASRRGVTLDVLTRDVKAVDSIPVTDAEIQEYYEENADDFPGGEAAAREPIRQILREEAAAERLAAFTRELRAKARVVVHLPPAPARMPLPGSGQPLPPTPPPGPPAPPGVAAEVNGVAIPLAAVDARLPTLPRMLEDNRRRALWHNLQAMIDDVLLEREATRRGVARDQLFEAVTGASQIPVNQRQVDHMLRQRPPGPGKDPQQARQEIMAQFRRRAAQPKWREFVKSLRDGASVKIYTAAPPARQPGPGSAPARPGRAPG